MLGSTTIVRDRVAASVLALVMSACSSTCGDDNSGPSTLGELGNGIFHYQCVGESDPVCAPGAFEVQMPACISVNGRFGLTFELRDDGAVNDGELDQFIFVESGNTTFVGGTGPFQALRAGRVAMLAREDEQVVDLIHLDLVVPETLELRHDGTVVSGTTFELAYGDAIVLDARVSDPDCTILGGAVELDVESSDTTVAQVTVGETIEVFAVGRGTATVTARVGAVEQFVAIEVATRLEPASSGGTGGSGSDSGTDDTGASEGSGTAGTGGSDSDGSGSETAGSSGSSGSTGG